MSACVVLNIHTRIAGYDDLKPMGRLDARDLSVACL